MASVGADQFVCIIDDDEAVRDSTKMLLDVHGFRTQAFSAARDFLENFDPESTGCLILDIHMPEMTGVELLSLLRSRGITTATIIVTGQRDAHLSEMLLRLGALALLDKPMTEEELIPLVHHALSIQGG